MAIKTILLPLRESESSAELLDTGLNAARHFDAHLRVLYARPSPEEMMPFDTFGLSSSMRQEVREAARRSSDSQAERLEALFHAACERAAIAIRPRGSESPARASAQWTDDSGQRHVLVARHGRLADLIIVPRPSRMTPPPASFDAAVRQSGRAVMMVPRGRVQRLIAENVVIAWNGSAAVAKAIAAAGPCLARASRITVLTTAKRAERPPTAAEVVEYLVCHGLAAKVELLEAQGRAVGPGILAACQRLDADLLVAGGYSRNRMSAMVFGGVTQHLMGEAELPVLMMH